MGIFLFLMLLGAAKALPATYTSKNVTIDFEISSNSSETYTVDLEEIVKEVCASRTRALKILVQSFQHVEVFMGNSNETNQEMISVSRYNIDELSLESGKMVNMTILSCRLERDNYEMDFTVFGPEGSKGSIVLEAVENEDHSVIELSYEFKINDIDGVYISLSDFEKVRSYITEQHLPQLNDPFYHMSITLPDIVDYTATIVKCGLVVFSIDPLMKNNQLIFKPEMLQKMDDSSDFPCDQNDTSLLMFIGAEVGTIGTLTIRVVKNQLTDEMISEFASRALQLTFFVFIIFVVFPLMCYLEYLERKNEEEELQASDLVTLHRA